MREKARRNRRERRIRQLMKLAIVCLVITFLYLVIVINFRLKNLQITGSEQYTEAELKQMLMTENTDDISFLFYLRHKMGKNSSIPFIQDMDFELVDKNTIHVQVYEKMIIGCAEVMGGYMYFDKDGIVVESTNVKLEDIPVVKGLKYNKIVLYEKLEVQKTTLFETILNITKLIYSHELPVQSISFNSDFEITLECNGNEVLLGKRDTYDEQIAALKSVLESSDSKKYSFDMRTYTQKDTTITAKPLE